MRAGPGAGRCRPRSSPEASEALKGTVRRAKRASPAPRHGVADRGRVGKLAREMASHLETGPVLSGGDVDADWQRAAASGDEAVGGSVATPDQDVVDEIGRALGVEQLPEAEVRTSDEILRHRDRLRWHLERVAADREKGNARSPRRRTSSSK